MKGWAAFGRLSLAVAAAVVVACGSGCKRAPDPSLVYVDIEQAAAARPEWAALSRFDEQARRLQQSAALPPTAASVAGTLDPVRFPAADIRELNQRREAAKRAIAQQRDAVIRQGLRLAQDRIERRRPVIRAGFEQQLEELATLQRRNLRIRARQIVNTYAELRAQLVLDRHNLLLQRENGDPLPDLDAQLAVIDQKLADYNARMEQDLAAQRRQNEQVMAEARRQIDRQVGEQVARELQEAYAAVRRRTEETPPVSLLLAQADPGSAAQAPAQTVQTAAFNPPAVMRQTAPRIAASLGESRDEWRQFLLAETRQAAELWAQSRGLQLAPAGARDATRQFIDDWIKR